MRKLVFVGALALSISACPEEHEDPCEACTDATQREACLAIVRDTCDASPEGSEEHEECEENADSGCTGAEGEGEGEGE